MRKTLLIAGAALAASIISSQAGVYSQNIVGYVNVPVNTGFTAVATPLDVGDNSATNYFDTTSGANDGSIVLTWAGTHYTQTMFDSTKSTGFTDAATGSSTLPPPVLTPGSGWLFNNQNASNTITFAGTVHVDGAGVSTNVVGVTTNVLSSSTVYVYPASKLPIGGGISSVLGLVNVGGALDGSIVLIPNIVGGAVHGYTQIMFDSTKATGFTDAATGSQTLAEPVIAVGGSFLFSNQTGNPISWVQSL
ncbi:MAG: hypothetical protein P4L95_02450 [Rouxiella aceris]|uniref:hypothetical protein n=1 Tax=Rouxiella aceris TaxID=2703884 RepID=UPI002848D83C|nr:hypothetical protein [Rouxiella aceris]MDR3430762.1 hypothetical protein [Rouxiella aceris]